MSKKTHLIIAGLASMTLFAGFTAYVDYFDQTRNKTIAGISTETSLQHISTDVIPPAQNPFLYSKTSVHANDTPPLQEQPQTLAQADPAPGQPAPPPAPPETTPLPNLPSIQTVPQPADASNNAPQVNPPAQAPVTPTPAPVKNKTTTTRAS